MNTTLVVRLGYLMQALHKKSQYKNPQIVDFANKCIFQSGDHQSGKQWLKYCTSDSNIAKLT